MEALGVFSREDVIIFLIITFLADTFYMFFFSGNIFHLNRYMIKGELDYFLLKPVHSQFMVSFRYVKSYAIISIFILSGLLIRQVLSYSNHISFLNWGSFLISFIMGTVLLYCVDFIISSICFWFKNFSVAGWFSNNVKQFSMKPDSIYFGALKNILLSIVPMAMIASIPVRFLIYGFKMDLFILQITICMIFFIGARYFWLKSLVKYESASS